MGGDVMKSRLGSGVEVAIVRAATQRQVHLACRLINKTFKLMHQHHPHLPLLALTGDDFGEGEELHVAEEATGGGVVGTFTLEHASDHVLLKRCVRNHSVVYDGLGRELLRHALSLVPEGVPLRVHVHGQDRELLRYYLKQGFRRMLTHAPKGTVDAFVCLVHVHGHVHADA